MERTRKLATAAVTLTLALAAGQYMEWTAKRARTDIRPTHVEAVSAGPGTLIAPALVTPSARRLPIDHAHFLLPEDQPTPAPMTADVSGPACLTSLTLAAEPAAMLALTLAAPCRPDERVVLRHAGLAVTGRLSSAGHLTAHLPALDASGSVSILFADGSEAQAAQPVPEVAALHRFGVQWLGSDAIEVSAHAGDAHHGDAGHVSAVDPGRTSDRGGFLSLLGETEVPLPMLAEVYTFPTDGTQASVQLEAEVTASTCARTLMGDVVESVGGRVFVTELTLEMPACDAVGDYIVLKNLSRNLNMAASQ
ncbi:hypothetical protein [Rhodobacter sp. NSM]|uniref:hypothetical protein n=1 Tax=Rhodobacter sp. NSM TaxID=3457501 RepID=UPI003FD3DE9F